MTPHERARSLLLQGGRQAEIAAATGLSRGTVAGLAHRLRQAGHDIVARGAPRGAVVLSVPRARDDELLGWIAARCRGASCAAIAAAAGVDAGQVQVATANVRAADLAESGEDPAAVAAAYWGWNR